MTRARCYVLAVLVAVCCLGPSSAFAQSGPGMPALPGPYPPNPGYAESPYETPAPLPYEPWYGDVGDVEASTNRVGPFVYTNGWYLRAEYLNWNIGKPGNVLLGAPVANNPDPTQPFVAFSPGTDAPLGIATVPSTRNINLGSTSGVQVTAGVDLVNGGKIEVSAFMLARKQSGFTLALGQRVAFDTDFDFPGLDPAKVELAEGESLPLVMATSTLSNGQVADHLFLYNISYQAVFQSQFWGAEANYFTDYDDVGFLQFRPLAGFRYFNLSERLTQRGVFQDVLLGGAPITTTIDSSTMNNLWGGQIGFRTEIITKYLNLGVTPKVMFLGDSALSQVFTNHFRNNSDPTVYSNDLTTTFTFGAEVGSYAQLNLMPNFSVRVGYNLIWIDRVTRPHRDIIYNDNGPNSPPDVHANLVFHDILITGFSIGGEFRF
ncbi:MAG TPA: BBP7 family outer membrane beta-barrel protein [Planctomycetaceae bacterium]|nr:BBP7 family outer membrane beta-barrel protein [Planctomycetaceae bacterium]